MATSVIEEPLPTITTLFHYHSVIYTFLENIELGTNGRMEQKRVQNLNSLLHVFDSTLSYKQILFKIFVDLLNKTLLPSQ